MGSTCAKQSVSVTLPSPVGQTQSAEKDTGRVPPVGQSPSLATKHTGESKPTGHLNEAEPKVAVTGEDGRTHEGVRNTAEKPPVFHGNGDQEGNKDIETGEKKSQLINEGSSQSAAVSGASSNPDKNGKGDVQTGEDITSSSGEVPLSDSVPDGNAEDSASRFTDHQNVPETLSSVRELENGCDSGLEDEDDNGVGDEEGESRPAPAKMAGIGELSITKPAPQFEANSVVDGTFKTVKLSDYRGKYLVLFFYPLDFTFVCPTEIIAFSDRVEEFRAIGCEVAACSTDSVYSHLAWVNTPRKQGGLGPMKIPLLADKTSEISKKYGCLKEDEGVAFRGLFIIDDKGNLRQITINDLPVGRSVDETLRLVQAFQFTDKHGEVCPAGWRPGKETMKPDPKGSQDYFSKAN